MSVPSKRTIRDKLGAYFHELYGFAAGDDALDDLHETIKDFARASAPAARGASFATLKQDAAIAARAGRTINRLMGGSGWAEAVDADGRLFAVHVALGDPSAPTVWIYPSGTIKIASFNMVLR
jgi:hypothetical protein